MPDRESCAAQSRNDTIWDKYYQSYQRGSHLPGVRYPNEHLVRFMAQWKHSPSWPKRRRPRILEFEFGTISNMAMMARFGCEVEGLEVSSNTAVRAKEAIEKLGMQEMLKVFTYDGGKRVPRPDRRYDAIIGLQCVYYNLNQKAFAAECARMLKPGGLLFFSFFSPRHGYMQYIDGVPGGPVSFREDHPNPRLVGLKLYLYRNEKQFSENFGKFFDLSIGIDEFNLLPVFQSWYYLRGQKNDVTDNMRLIFPLSQPARFTAPGGGRNPWKRMRC